MSGQPDWYEPGNISESISTALSSDRVDRAELVSVLAQNELDGPGQSAVNELTTASGTVDEGVEDRIMEMITIAVEQQETVEHPPEVYSTAEEEPPQRARYVDRSDITHLTDIEFAHLMGLVFTQYEGTYQVVMDAVSEAVDLVWNRAHSAAVFRTVGSTPDDSTVDTVEDLGEVESDTLDVYRGIAQRGVISTGTSIEKLRSAAQDTAIQVYGPDAIDDWLDSVKFPRSVLAPILQVGREHSDVTSDVQPHLAEIPEPISNDDPLATIYDETGHNWDGPVSEEYHGEVKTDDSAEQDDTIDPGGDDEERQRELDEEAEPGQKGTLYADPSMDGDFDSIDEYIDAVDADGEDG